MSKFVEAYLYYSNGEDVSPPKKHFVKLSEIKRIVDQGDDKDLCSFYLYKDDVYGAEMTAKALVKLIDEDSKSS